MALPAEGRTLLRTRLSMGAVYTLPGGHHLAVSGTGPAQAEALGQALLQRGIEGLVSWGCAAALSPRLQTGDLLLPETVMDEADTPHRVHVAWHREIRAQLSIPPCEELLMASARLIAAPSDKRALHLRTGAAALDMESGALARLAAHSGLPFVVIRSVSDEAGTPLPAPVLGALSERGEVQMARLLGGLIKTPSALPDLIRLGQGFGNAMKALKGARVQLGPDLGLNAALRTPS